jgi:hypothetical protein
MPPLDLDDLAVLQAELEVLDERDLIAELAPDLAPGPLTASPAVPAVPVVLPVPLPAAVGRVVGRVAAEPSVTQPTDTQPTDSGPGTQPPVRALPAVPAPVDRPARRRGALPAISPSREPVAPPAAELDDTRPTTGRPPVPGMTVVRVLPAVPAPAPVPGPPPASSALASPAMASTAVASPARRARHAAADPAPAGRGLLSWLDGGTAR